MGYFAALLDPRIAIAEAPMSGEADGLMAGEAASVANAVARRRLEFAVGRTCARNAIASLGHTKVALLRGENRMPVWPADLVGSITHTDTWAAAAVARREDGFTAIGIDLEPSNELSADLWTSVCSSDEQAAVARIDGMTPGLAAHLVFCMKEAAFKCQFPISGAMLEFTDLAIDVGADGGTFSATFRKSVAPFKVDDRLMGKFAVTHDHIASAVVISSERMP